MLDAYGRDCKQIRGVLAVGQECVAILKPTHGPEIFSALQNTMPLNAVGTAIQTHLSVAVHLARFDHRGEENCITHAATVD